MIVKKMIVELKLKGRFWALGEALLEFRGYSKKNGEVLVKEYIEDIYEYLVERKYSLAKKQLIELIEERNWKLKILH